MYTRICTLIPVHSFLLSTLTCTLLPVHSQLYTHNKILNLMYADLNRLLVGSGLIPINIKLQQDNRTVCCGHAPVG